MSETEKMSETEIKSASSEKVSSSSKPLRIGTRASRLALWQANWCASVLQAAQIPVEIIHITATGDHPETFSQPIPTGGAQGIFTKEIEEALLENRVDLAVHSLKDLPTDTVPGLQLTAVPERANVEDVLVTGRSAAAMQKLGPNSNKITSLADLPDGTVLGTSSMRRRAQLLFFARVCGKKWEIRNVRGNLNTRLRKLDEGLYDALILARAGVERLELSERITAVLPIDEMFPAVSQGALGLETRTGDARTNNIVRKHLNSETVFHCTVAERTLLKALDGGCAAPIGGLCRFDAVSQTFTLRGRVIAVDGRILYEESITGSDPAELGETLARQLNSRGADLLIREARSASNGTK